MQYIAAFTWKKTIISKMLEKLLIVGSKTDWSIRLKDFIEESFSAQ